MDKQLDHERIDGELRILEAASADAARRILKLESAQLKELKEANKWKKMN